MMEETVVEGRAGDTSNLITSVPVQMVSEPRVEVISKPVVTMTPVTVTTANGVPQELIAAQYINIHRVPEQLNKVLVSDALSSDLLSHHVDLTTAADFAQHGVTTQYYDTDDLLTHDLSEEDRRLAAELVAVQLKHQHQQNQQQQQQTQILPTPVTSLGALQAVNMDRSTISAAIVTSYIQAVEDEVVHQHLLQQQQQQQESSDRCIMKIYQQPTAHELQQALSRQQLQHAQPLPPLKKVLSNQMVLRSKFQTTTPTVMVQVPGAPPIMETAGVSDGSATVKLEAIEKSNQTVNAHSNVQPLTPGSGQGAGQPTEDLDSDYDAESDTRPSRRSLPHKKRIPRKLKAPPARSIHTKCYKCNKCGESFTTQTAFSSHKATHVAPAKQRPSANGSSSLFSCELCSKQFNSQLKFFEHLKQHYEPNSCGPGNNNTGSSNLSINSANTSSGNSLPELTPAPIVATCIPPLSVSQHEASSVAHSVVVVSSASQSAQLSVSGRPQGVVSLHPGASSNAATPPHPLTQSTITVKDAFSINNELGQGVVKEEIVTSTGLACNQCGETFRKSKALDTHLATAHPRQEVIEEFSEPEDMMDGISIRHVVNISNVISGNEGDCGEEEEHCDGDDKLKSWRYQEVQDLGMDLQDIPCLPLPTGATLSHHGQVNHHNGHGHQGGSTPTTIVPDDDSNHLDDEDVDDPSPINTRIRVPVNVNSNNNNNNNNSVLSNSNIISVASIGSSNSRKKQLQCPECDRTFNHRNSLLYHIRSHSGSRPHQCEVCGKSFFSASALKVHMRLHSGDKPYKCEFCSRHFRQWGDLKYHVTSLHSDQKQFQCEYCGKDFARKYSLIVHRRIHTGEKNYKCEFCGKTFRASSYLQNHRRIHTGEKPHSCDICGKPFRVRSDMKRHRQTHNRERPASRSTSVATSALNSDDDNSGGESILPDNAVAMPLNLNIRQGDSNDSITYSRTTASLEREGNTLYVWIPAASDSNLLSDE